MGGLGNQLFQFCYGRYLSRYGALDLILDYAHPSVRKSDRNLPDLFDIVQSKNITYDIYELESESKRLLNLAIRVSSKNSTFAKISRIPVKLALEYLLSKAHGQKKEKIQVYLANGIGGESENSKSVIQNVYAVGYFQTRHYFTKLVEQDQTIVKKFTTFVRSKQERWNEFSPNNSALMHLRRGDYLTSNFGNLSLEYYRSALEVVKAKYGISSFYVISDDESIYPLSGLNELSPDIHFISSKNLTAAQVLGLMAQFKILIGANSSLSWWGAALGGIANNTIGIFPEPWFTNSNSPNNLIMETWHTIHGDIWKGPNSVE